MKISFGHHEKISIKYSVLNKRQSNEIDIFKSKHHQTISTYFIHTNLFPLLLRRIKMKNWKLIVSLTME